MHSPLRVLHLEDDFRDTELVGATLEAEGIQSELQRVETESDFVAVLQGGDFDLILADYSLPTFDGLSALKLAQRHTPDLPFIFVSGKLGEDVAIEALKTGATDYVLKTRLARLGPAVTRALREAREKTERKRAEAALRDSEEQWKATFEWNPAMYFMIDRAGRTVSVNAFGANQLGYQKSELVGLPVLSIFDEADREPVRRNIENCFNNHGSTFRWEARKIRKDGTVIWVRETASTLLLKNQPVLLVVCEDITDRKRAEDGLRRSEKELRDLIESIPAMAFVTRADGTNEFVSRQWIEYSGLSREQSAGGGWAASLHPDDLDEHVATWRAALKAGKPFENESRHRDAAGNYRWLLVRAVPLRDDQSNILKWYGVLADIEDRKRAEALLASENRVLEMVARGDSLSQILDRLCELVEEQVKGVFASILLVQDGRLRHGGAPDLPKAYIDAIDGAVIGPSAGSCGTAAYTGKQVISEDISTDPLWVDYRDAALAHSLRACWSTPIFSTVGRVIGTFAMYYREQCRPTVRDQEIIQQITHLAGIAIERKLTQDKLSLSERNLAEAQRLTHTGSFVWDIVTNKGVYLSDEWYRIYGFEIGDPLAWEQRLHRLGPEQARKWQAAVDRAIEEKSDYELEKLLVCADGITKQLHAIGHPVLNSSGDVVQFIGTVTDITERKRAEALLRGEKQLLEMIATGIPLKEILNALCHIIEEQRPGTLASVLLMNPDGAHLDVAAGPSLPRQWTRQMEEMPIGPCAGSCGTAAYRGSPVIVSDITSDPLWEVPKHRTSALKHGLRASWSNPVLSWQGKVLGTFCMYYRESRTPTAEDLELIELATHLARVAIERDRAEGALRASEQLARSHVEVMMRSLDVLATESAPEKFIGEMLRTIGQQLHAIRVILWLFHPEDDSLHIQLMIENDRQVPPDPEHPWVKDPHGWKKGTPFVQEMLFTKSPAVCDDIERDPRIDLNFRKYLMNRGAKRFMAVPMFVSGELRGFIGIQHSEKAAYRAEEVELAQALAHHVMLATHEQELVEQQRHAAILKERTRMARDIHDTLAQGFTGVIVQMEAAEEALLQEDREHVIRHVRRARELARESLGEARRSVHALRPQVLEKAAFADALKAVIRNTTAGTSLHTDFQLRGQPRQLPAAVEENLLHIGQEALSNALKHAHATNFQAHLSFESDAVRLELSDDGDGFAVGSVNGGGFGLLGMKERAEQIGATVELSSKPGAGTRIVAVSPYQQQLA